jgi:hypothetical protein
LSLAVLKAVVWILFRKKKMKNFKKLSGIVAAVIIATASALVTHKASAGSYSAVVNLPVLHARGYAYVANVPLPSAAKKARGITNVNWNWSVQG